MYISFLTEPFVIIVKHYTRSSYDTVLMALPATFMQYTSFVFIYLLLLACFYDPYIEKSLLNYSTRQQVTCLTSHIISLVSPPCFFTLRNHFGYLTPLLVSFFIAVSFLCFIVRSEYKRMFIMLSMVCFVFLHLLVGLLFALF